MLDVLVDLFQKVYLYCFTYIIHIVWHSGRYLQSERIDFYLVPSYVLYNQALKVTSGSNQE